MSYERWGEITSMVRPKPRLLHVGRPGAEQWHGGPRGREQDARALARGMAAAVRRRRDSTRGKRARADRAAKLALR